MFSEKVFIINLINHIFPPDDEKKNKSKNNIIKNKKRIKFKNINYYNNNYNIDSLNTNIRNFRSIIFTIIKRKNSQMIMR